MRVRWSRWLLSGAVLLVWTAVPRPAQAQFSIPGLPQIVIDPKNLIENARQAAQMAEQIRYQLQALQKLRNPTWRDIDGHIRQVEYLLQQGEALGYSVAQLDRQFRETFPGYQAAASRLDLPKAQRIQARRTLGTMQAALNVLSANAQQFRAGQSRLGQIKAQMAGIQGTQQALELQSTLDAFLAEEVGLLRQTVATQANLQAVYNAYQVNEQEQMRANYRAMMDRMSTPPRYQADYSLRIRP
jgi:P-type conjugative transfer protein TrbJ